MGGFGSGRDDYATTPTVGSSYSLDADHLTDGVDHPGEAVGRKWWGDREDPTLELELHFEAREEDADRAEYVRIESSRVDQYTGEKSEQSHPVALEYTECNFGGVRPWFRCPGVVDGEQCGRRTRKLHLPRGGEYWLCRECYDLGYASSRASGNDIDTALLRYKRAFAKADAEGRRPHPSNAPYLPERPKGMHHDTFADLLDDVQAASEEWHQAVDAQMRQLAEKHGRISWPDEPMV